MQLEVTLTPAEWLEVEKLSSLAQRRLVLLTRVLVTTVLLAEPLALLLRYAGRAPMGMILERIFTSPVFWIFLVLDIVLLPPVMNLWTGRRAARRGTPPTRPLVLDFSGQGIAVYAEGRRIRSYTYAALTDVQRVAGFLLGRHNNLIIFVVPLRCFATPADSIKLETLLKNGMMQHRLGRAAALAVHSEPALWDFRFVFEQTALRRANRMLLKGQRRRMVRVVWQAAGVFLLAVGLLWMFVGTVSPGEVYALLSLVLAMGVFSVLASRRRVRRHRLLAPAFLDGACALEVHEDGLRFYNKTIEYRLRWAEITDVRGGRGIALILQGPLLMAPLPYSADSFEAIRAALDYIHARVNGKAPVALSDPATGAPVAEGL